MDRIPLGYSFEATKPITIEGLLSTNPLLQVGQERIMWVMMLSTWVQFTWKLADLPDERPRLDKRYVLDLARIPEDSALLDSAISQSCSMEAAWAHDLNPRLKVMRELIEHQGTSGQVLFLAIKHGTRVVGASFIRPGVDFSTNLPVGVCVLNEYRCRGLGTALLYDSLNRLKQKGMETAKVVTKKGLTADRFFIS